MSMMIQPARFVPPLPPEPVVFREYKNGSGINAISYTFTNMAIGTANAARWVIAAIFINHNTSRSLVSVTIGGVSATLLYGAPALSVPGGRWEFWKANVPTGTTASVPGSGRWPAPGPSAAAGIRTVQPSAETRSTASPP